MTVDQAEDMETTGGYAKEVSDDYKQKQAKMMKEALKKMILLFVRTNSRQTGAKNTD